VAAATTSATTGQVVVPHGARRAGRQGRRRPTTPICDCTGSHTDGWPRTERDGFSACLTNVCGPNQRATRASRVSRRCGRGCAASARLRVYGVDKFPRMRRIRRAHRREHRRRGPGADWARYGVGTTVIETRDSSTTRGRWGLEMVEGRISGGGGRRRLGPGGCASIKGRCQAVERTVISIGKHCLLRRQLRAGDSLGATCVIEAGLYVQRAPKSLPEGT